MLNWERQFPSKYPFLFDQGERPSCLLYFVYLRPNPVPVLLHILLHERRPRIRRVLYFRSGTCRLHIESESCEHMQKLPSSRNEFIYFFVHNLQISVAWCGFALFTILLNIPACLPQYLFHLYSP